MGRKITKPFTDDLAEEICERLIEGESLRSICRDEHMPSAATVCRWQVERPEFAEQYARARAAQADTLADELLDIADDDAEDVNRSRLRVDARKWIAAKLKPRKYGDRQTIAGDPDAPIKHEHSIDASKLSTEALRELVALKKSQS